MDLLEHYQEKIKYTGGVYHISVEGMTMEQVHMLMEQWSARFKDAKPLIVMPDDRDIHHAEHFDFGIAFRLLRSDWKVAMRKKPHFYLFYDSKKNAIMKKVVRSELDLDNYKATVYQPDPEELMAEWIIYR